MPDASVLMMSAQKTVTFYLHPKLRRQAENGNHNFVGKVCDVLRDTGFDIAFDNDDDIARLRAVARRGYSLFLMNPPVNDRGLTFRKTYVFPFWHIEKQAERWKWPVAQTVFDASVVDARKAKNFYRRWQEHLFDRATSVARRDGFVLIPLQGQLLRQRSFQTCSPIEMVETTLEHEKKRQIVITLHPSETYSPEEEQAIETLLHQHDRLFLRSSNTERYLQNCDYVVTQNSAVGFNGYFFRKPLILFAKSDFHHIALNVSALGAADAFAAVDDHKPDYAAYLYWFLQEQSINAGRPEARSNIRTALVGHGWPIA